MDALHVSQLFAQCRTTRHGRWSLRVVDFIAALTLVFAVTPVALGQSTEIAYNTFLDPNNANDPRAAAQTKMIAEFERLNPTIKVRVVVDPAGANGARTLRTHADSPDVIRATSEPAATLTVPPPPDEEPDIDAIKAIVKEHGYELLV